MKYNFSLALIILVSTQVFGQNKCVYSNIGCNTQIEVIKNPNKKSSSSPCIINTIPSPTSGTVSLAFDGTDLWVGADPYQIIKISPIDGTVLKTLNTGIESPYGLAFINGFLWVTDNDLSTVNKVDTANGNTIVTHNTLHQSFETGLAWDGEKLWHCSTGANSISFIDTLIGTDNSSHSVNLMVPVALTFQGNDLWVGDNFSHKIYKMDTTTFNFIDSIDSPKQYPNGLAFDGQYMWVAENENSAGIDSIYQLDLNCFTTFVLENTFENELKIYPNPTDGNFSINLGNKYQTTVITITDLKGRTIQSKSFTDSQLLNLKLEEPTGIYLLIIESENKKAIIRLVKE